MIKREGLNGNQYLTIDGEHVPDVMSYHSIWTTKGAKLYLRVMQNEMPEQIECKEQCFKHGRDKDIYAQFYITLNKVTYINKSGEVAWARLEYDIT